jgi:hypothetical protein
MTSVQITRDRHPLQGRTLQLLGQRHCRGQLELLLILPDGSKSLIPAAWTDFTRAEKDTGGAGVDRVIGQLAGPAQVLQACVLVSGLLVRAAAGPEQAARQSPCKEDDRAACPTQSAPRADTRATDRDDPPSSRSAGATSCRSAGPPDHEDGSCQVRGGR